MNLGKILKKSNGNFGVGLKKNYGVFNTEVYFGKI